ncbi:MAG: hypothetical protein CMK74_01065 [Pseudomonadales bacterium]|jgi:hypothetical protein|nr:hypothetical protein [Pseudomonadales bacterium]
MSDETKTESTTTRKPKPRRKPKITDPGRLQRLVARHRICTDIEELTGASMKAELAGLCKAIGECTE